MTTQGDLRLLNDPVAQAVLRSTIPARLAYAWHDGTPRVVPNWFHWTGEEVVMGTPPDAPKVAAIRERPRVAVTIDGDEFPCKVLMMRDVARCQEVPGMAPDYAAVARRFFGEEEGDAWTAQMAAMVGRSARIAVRPEWVGILDFQTRFPSAVAKRMG